MKNSAFLDLPQSGIASQSGGSASLDGVLVEGAYATNQNGELTALYGGFALEVEASSSASIARSAFLGCMLAGLSVNTGSKVTATNLLIQGTLELPYGQIGSAVEVFDSASFSLTDGLLLDSIVEGVIVENATASFDATTIRDTTTLPDGTFGAGLVVLENANVSLSSVGIDGNASIGLVADDSQVSVQAGALANNAVGIQAQDGSFLTESDDQNSLEPGEVRVSYETIFLANGSKDGSGVVPLPSVNVGPP